MKRLIILLMIAALALTGCKSQVNDEEIPQSFTVYASFYPIYALSALIVDENIPNMSLKQLVQPQDGCLRDYSLSDWDFYLLMSAADAVIWGGAGLESFGEAFYSLGEDGPAVISAMNELVLKNESGAEESESHFSGVNPWLFLSVDGAEQIAEAVCAHMIALDEPYAAQYMENLGRAYDRFAALREEMGRLLTGCDVPVALMHEGLSYFAEEWNLNVVCALEHESGVEESDETLASMLAELAACGAQAVLIEKQAPAALVQALCDNGYGVALFDTLSTGRADEGADGYFIKMRENARQAASVLRKNGE